MASNLDHIKHIVVLMMENRSFDHMLGYLKADKVLDESLGLDGLVPDEHGCPWPDGTWEPVKPMEDRVLHHKVQDPGHDGHSVEAQLKDRNQGFLMNYIEHMEKKKAEWRADEKKQKHDPVPPDDKLPPEAVLSYQRAVDVPVYDWIARNYVVCDRWFSSVAGPTWPNRMYALTGGVPPKDKDLIEKKLKLLPDWLEKKIKDKLDDAPLYKGQAFTRWLRQDTWRWYSHDPATLRAADSAYRPGGDDNLYTDANFAYFSKGTLLEPNTFLADARSGNLRAVSWIDPNFVDVRLIGPAESNDDHPPSRILLGQELVLTVLLALAESPCWDSTMLLITYDEHGGFYDHVVPSDHKCPGDGKQRLGVRVPALVVSPWIDHTVSHTVFDHTSIPKTILTRFADEPMREKAFDVMGERTRHANDLGELINRDKPRKPPIEGLQGLVDAFLHWKADTYHDVYKEKATLAEQMWELSTDLQGDVMSLGIALREREVPPGKP